MDHENNTKAGKPDTTFAPYQSVFSHKRIDKFRHFALTFTLLFLFWLLLSGHYDLFHISIGIFCCLLVSYSSSEFLFVHVGAGDSHLIILRLLTYVPWHLYQIIISNIYLAKLVFSPISRLNPHIIHYKTKLTNGLALVTYANSITLTPGTITIDLNDDTFYVHAIDSEVADDLLTGEMENRIEKVFQPVAHAKERASTMLAAEANNLIVKTIVRIFTPFIQIYGLYVIAHGHYSPGGGFQGGVILAASIILLALAFGLRKTISKVTERLTTMLCSCGVFIYGGIGLLCLLLGGNFLDYEKLDLFLKVGTPQARSLGILGVEIGVGIAVMACMISIFFDIAMAGELPDDPLEMTQKPVDTTPKDLLSENSLSEGTIDG
ncbi:MAG: Na(+)/H(+) antiporter subunit B [Deltaproteobacteria bacterium]|nr:MAG: Na(+)/H(+) antiporter subunit B [Deltaproteobacteria bacterium]